MTVLWRDGEPIAQGPRRGGHHADGSEGPAIYRAEIITGTDGGSIPWIISNPIYVGVAFPPAPVPIVASESPPLFDGTLTKWWRTEVAPGSKGDFDVVSLEGTPEAHMRFGLSPALATGPYASMGVELPNGAAPYRRVAFVARADRPMRINVRFRRVEPPGEHWQRSVYIDETPDEHVIDFDDATPVSPTRTRHPAATDIHDVLFVVDLTYAKPGATGQFWVRNVRLQR